MHLGLLLIGCRAIRLSCLNFEHKTLTHSKREKAGIILLWITPHYFTLANPDDFTLKGKSSRM